MLLRLTGQREGRRPIPRMQVESLEARKLLSTSVSPMVQLLVPAYFDPADDAADWARLATAAKTVPLTAIVNPNSGPGETADPLYVDAITNVRKNGRVVGYVHTSYGARPLSEVEDEVRAYRSFYKLDGIFLDEMADTAEALGYYRRLYSDIKLLNPNYQVIGNPGTDTLESYLDPTNPTADTLVTFEDTQADYATADPPEWVRSHDAGEFANIVYGVPGSDAMRLVVAKAIERNVSYIYTTDDGADGNPYDRLPNYWEKTVFELPAKNAGDVFVSGQTWSQSFKQTLANRNLGSARLGFRISGLTNFSQDLPWSNIDTLSFALKSVQPPYNLANIHVTGSGGATYAVRSAERDPEQRNVLVVQLGEPLVKGDHIQVTLHNIQNPRGSGDAGVAFDLLPGDADRDDRVNATDLVKVRNRIGAAADSSPAYSPWFDINADGGITAPDLVLVRNRVGTNLSLPKNRTLVLEKHRKSAMNVLSADLLNGV